MNPYGFRLNDTKRSSTPTSALDIGEDYTFRVTGRNNGMLQCTVDGRPVNGLVYITCYSCTERPMVTGDYVIGCVVDRQHRIFAIEAKDIAKNTASGTPS